MSGLIVTIFIAGYLFIALEHITKVNKSSIALLMSVVCWGLYSLVAGQDSLVSGFSRHVYDTCETILFLMGAMTIVAIVDTYGGFNFVTSKLRSKNLKTLLWKTVGMTFILSALLDNMTTCIVMIMVLQKLIKDRKTRLLFAGLTIIAANAGGAFSPIGDVTTIMLWIKGFITAEGVLTHLFIPSVVSIIIPTLFILPMLKRQAIVVGPYNNPGKTQSMASNISRKTIFFIGVGGLILVPIFRSITGLPPFLFVMGVLALLWISTEIMIRFDGTIKMSGKEQAKVSNIITTIDMSTILFFLGTLLTVGAVEETGTLNYLGQWLRNTLGNVYLINGLIGVFSSIIDNVPLVASTMGMYQIEPLTAVGDMQNYCQDGTFWQLLAYCAGTGGSILIIGSAAGVIVMGMEKISFSWYLKHFSWIALLGYIAGIIAYALMEFAF